jgi:hypothetical protein
MTSRDLKIFLWSLRTGNFGILNVVHAFDCVFVFHDLDLSTGVCTQPRKLGATPDESLPVLSQTVSGYHLMCLVGDCDFCVTSALLS